MAYIKSVFKNIWQFKSWIFLLIATLAPIYLVTDVNTKVTWNLP